MDIGGKIRTVCDYLDSLPGEAYDYMIGPASFLFGNDGKGPACVIAHAMNAGLLHTNDTECLYDSGIRQLGFDGSVAFYTVVSRGKKLGGVGNGESAKHIAVMNLRAYADARYPIKHEGIPESVLQIFKTGETDVSNKNCSEIA